MVHRLPALAALLLFATAGPGRGEMQDCSCQDFDKLQQELSNAVTLRDRHAAKAAELEARLKAGQSVDSLRDEYRRWEEDTKTGAGAGLAATVQGQQAAIGFETRGSKIASTLEGWSSPVTRADGYVANQYDAAKARALEEAYRKKGQDLCDFADPAAIKKAAEATSFCKGVADITLAHEQAHQKTCREMGFIKFFFRSPVELALDEVNAYNKQIAALEKLIGNALKGAEVQFEDSSKVTWSAQMASFQYTFATSKTRAAVPENDGKTWSATLRGTHRASADRIVIAGRACTMTPVVRDVEIGVSANGQHATIEFKSFGPTGNISVRCPGGGGAGGGPADRSGESYSMPLRLSSSHTEDVSKTKAAQMMQGLAKVSGTYNSTLSIICPAANK